MNIEKYIIKKGSYLYRFVNCEPSKIIMGMTPKSEQYGRCDKNQGIYYCSRSISALNLEFSDKDLTKGSLVKAEVMDDIICGCVTDSATHKKLRGRVDGENQKLVHSEVLEKFDYDIKTTYEETNAITDMVLQKFPEGIAYSSVNGMDAIVGSIVFYVADGNNDFGPFENIALTELGFKKIKQLPPEKWHHS